MTLTQFRNGLFVACLTLICVDARAEGKAQLYLPACNEAGVNNGDYCTSSKGVLSKKDNWVDQETGQEKEDVDKMNGKEIYAFFNALGKCNLDSNQIKACLNGEVVATGEGKNRKLDLAKTFGLKECDVNVTEANTACLNKGKISRVVVSSSDGARSIRSYDRYGLRDFMKENPAFQVTAMRPFKPVDLATVSVSNAKANLTQIKTLDIKTPSVVVNKKDPCSSSFNNHIAQNRSPQEGAKFMELQAELTAKRLQYAYLSTALKKATGKDKTTIEAERKAAAKRIAELVNLKQSKTYKAISDDLDNKAPLSNLAVNVIMAQLPNLLREQAAYGKGLGLTQADLKFLSYTMESQDPKDRSPALFELGGKIDEYVGVHTKKDADAKDLEKYGKLSRDEVNGGIAEYLKADKLTVAISGIQQAHPSCELAAKCDLAKSTVDQKGLGGVKDIVKAAGNSQLANVPAEDKIVEIETPKVTKTKTGDQKLVTGRPATRAEWEAQQAKNKTSGSLLVVPNNRYDGSTYRDFSAAMQNAQRGSTLLIGSCTVKVGDGFPGLSGREYTISAGKWSRTFKNDLMNPFNSFEDDYYSKCIKTRNLVQEAEVKAKADARAAYHLQEQAQVKARSDWESKYSAQMRDAIAPVLKTFYAKATNWNNLFNMKGTKCWLHMNKTDKDGNQRDDGDYYEIKVCKNNRSSCDKVAGSGIRHFQSEFEGHGGKNDKMAEGWATWLAGKSYDDCKKEE